MKKDYIVELREEEAEELMDYHWVGELVRCKDCKYFPSVPQQEPSCWKNRRRGDDPDWYCADGERRGRRMKWEEHQKKMPMEQEFPNRILTDIECPKCGKKIWKRTDIVLTSYPAQYMYECECGWVGYAHT